MERLPWIERQFYFDIPTGWLPNILERLHGTGLRLRELTSHLHDHKAALKHHEKWSIKEHIGHLTDLEALHLGRVSDYIFREPSLRAADMSNQKTNLANHNAKPVIILISEFITARNNFIQHLEKLDDDTLNFASMHPRLKVSIRPVDMAFFTAEHDDHHLASIRVLLTAFI